MKNVRFLFNEKLSKLQSLLKSYKKVAIAFSGGVDSSFLSKKAFEVLGENAVAITVDSMFIPRVEIRDAESIAREIGIRHMLISFDRMDDLVLSNTEQRCYHCKKAIFGILLEATQKEGMTYLLDGSNIDDLSDYRPGLKALEELNIESPLVKAGFTKDDIRQASKNLGLSTAGKPSLACLATRLPYHQRITPTSLKMVEKAEDFLKNSGFEQVRVRYHENLARIEVDPSERYRFINIEYMDTISKELKKLGFKYITLDLEGYKTGKMN